MEKLNKYADNIYSQHGEDGILKYIVNALGKKIHKSCCEFGAWDGLLGSNSCRFWKELGWDALLIEADKKKYSNLVENCKNFDKVKTANTKIEINGENSIDEICKRNNFAPKIGIISIDIDSVDYHVWKYMQYVDPQIVIIEHNYLIDPEVEYHDPETSYTLLCSSSALAKLGEKKGYFLICCTETNSIFIKKNLYDAKLFPKYPDIDVYHRNNRQVLLRRFDFFIGHHNTYPIFYKKTNFVVKLFFQFLFRCYSLTNKFLYFKKPSPQMQRHIRNYDFDF